MAARICGGCQSRNAHAGRCHICGRPLGSLLVAVQAGVGSAAALGLGWIALSWLTGLQLPWIATLYGGLVSGAVLHWSWGRGWLYQGIASACTIAGMLFADTVVVRMHWRQLVPTWPADAPPPPIGTMLQSAVLYDAAAIMFATLGVMGGAFLWRQADP